MSEVWRTIKHSLPNSSGELFTLVHRNSAAVRGNPNWPCKLVQIVGGRNWSISFIKLDPIDKGQPWLDVVEEAHKCANANDAPGVVL